MTAVSEKTRPHPALKKRADWSAWHVGDNEVRVQINHPDLAKAFSKVKGTWLAGYAVKGSFMKLFHIKQSVPWVESWMRDFKGRISSDPAKGKEIR